MVDITGRIQAIIAGYIRKNKYFVINRARQYGKTTLLYGLEERLKAEYLVLSLSFEAADEYFQSSYALAEGLVMDIADCLRSLNVPEEGLLRAKYLEQQKKRDMTFQSVILAGVYDIKNLKLKLHLDQEPKLTDECIAGTEIFPDKKSAWTREGISAAEMLLRRESNTLFDDMAKKFADYPDLKSLLKDILFKGSSFPFDPDNHLIRLGITFGFLKEKNGNVAIQNRIFETKMYDLFLSEDSVDSIIYRRAAADRNQFLTGNYYIEAQTRDMKRTDIIVDYLGQQYIIELKIWHGEEYNKKGKRQLAESLEYYNKDTGYLLSFSFHQKKQVGVRETLFAGKRIIEAIV